MPHLRSFRLGWQSQVLAKFLLYRFSFVAEPTQVADDIGIDYYCTLFEETPTSGGVSLLPRNSFAIQVKSKGDSDTIDLDTLVPCLERLELPFFIGIVDRGGLSMQLFSGEFLTPFFAYRGNGQRLTAKLCDRTTMTALMWYKGMSLGQHVILFPKIGEITAGMESGALGSVVRSIQDSCSLMLRNLASNISKQFIFETADPDCRTVFAGPESVRFFELNLLKRLDEVFANLEWAHSVPVLHSYAEQRFVHYEALYQMVAESPEDGSLEVIPGLGAPEAVRDYIRDHLRPSYERARSSVRHEPRGIS